MTAFTLSVKGSKPLLGDLQLNTFVPSNVFRVRKWGDPIMVAQAGLSVSIAGTSNFQAVGLYNKSNNMFGGVSNYLRIPYVDVMRLKALQVEDEYKDKQPDWRKQKMNWLCKDRGTIYFTYHHASSGDWSNLDYIEWGTIELGWNYCTVEDIETLTVRVPGENSARPHKMAKLAGFRKADWSLFFDALGNYQPGFHDHLMEFVARGLICRCYCAYSGDDIGDSPKGIVYSPFWSPRDWTFIGPAKPQIEAFYIPEDWLMPV